MSLNFEKCVKDMKRVRISWYKVLYDVSLLQVISCFTVKLKFNKLSQHKDIQRCTQNKTLHFFIFI